MEHNQLPTDRKFAYSVGLAFLAITLYCYVVKVNLIITFTLLLLGTFLTVSGFFKPTYLRSLNEIWAKLGFFMAQIISPIVLSLIFFVMITPFAVITKLFGRDELELSFKINCLSSYWKIREHTEYSEEYFRQF